jgi:hypothetical protein
MTAAGTTAERQTVLHSWCIQTEWNAPTVGGGEGARLHTETLELLDRLLGELGACVARERNS